MKNVNRLVILMIGPPGVGKGTYSRMLSKDLNIPELSSGEELRKLVRTNTSGDAQLADIKNTIERGAFLEDKFMFDFMKNKLAKEEFNRGLILDGYPRNINQAKDLEQLIDLNLVVKIELKENILIRKLCGRRVCINCGKNYNVCSIKEEDYDMEPLLPREENKCDECSGKLIRREDDEEETIKKRLDLYKTQTSPIEDYYNKRGILSNFEPKKGIKDYPILLQLVKKTLLI